MSVVITFYLELLECSESVCYNLNSLNPINVMLYGMKTCDASGFLPDL